MNWNKKNDDYMTIGDHEKLLFILEKISYDEEFPWLLQMSIFGNEEVYIGQYESIKDAEDELKDLSKEFRRFGKSEKL